MSVDFNATPHYNSIALMLVFVDIFATDELKSLTCNTEKDKHSRLNFRTAG